jgi:uncharacterized OB-fold protein
MTTPVATNVTRPRPTPFEWDAEFWRAAGEGRLVVQACSACGLVRSFPRIMCSHCGSLEYTWLEATGTGTVYSWTVLRRQFHPGFGDLPLVVCIIQLDDHPAVRLIANLLDDEDAVDGVPVGLSIGARVAVEFENLGDIVLPQFRLVAT